MVVFMYKEFQTSAFYKCINDIEKVLHENYELIKDTTIILDSTWDLLDVDPFIEILSKSKYFNIDKLEIHEAVDLSKFHNKKTYYTALSNQFGWYDSLRSECLDWANIKIDKHFVALVRRPTMFRAEFLKLLIDMFPNDARVSFGTINRPNSYLDPYKKVMHPYSIPITLDKEQLDLIGSTYSPNNQIIYQNLVNVVLENSVDHLYVTEKTFKAFAWHQIPVFFAAPNHVQKIRSFGFDVFDDLINHDSYDLEQNTYKRKLKVISALKKFHTINGDPQVLREKIFDRLIDNDKILKDLVEEERKRFDPHDHLMQLKSAGIFV